ncbi:MAG: hypothetical protein RL023_328 [Candidatus Parcubacteria bacterium]|jgi:hypothetical protein
MLIFEQPAVYIYCSVKKIFYIPILSLYVNNLGEKRFAFWKYSSILFLLETKAPPIWWGFVVICSYEILRLHYAMLHFAQDDETQDFCKMLSTV